MSTTANIDREATGPSPQLPPFQSSAQPLGTPANEWATSLEKSLSTTQPLDKPTVVNEVLVVPLTEQSIYNHPPVVEQAPISSETGYNSVATTPGPNIPGAWLGSRPPPQAAANTIGTDLSNAIGNLGQTAYNFLPKGVINAVNPNATSAAQSISPPITTTSNHPGAAGPPGTTPPQPIGQAATTQQAQDTLNNVTSTLQSAGERLTVGAKNMGSAITNAIPSTSPTTSTGPPASGPVGHPSHPADGEVPAGYLQQVKDVLGGFMGGSSTPPTTNSSEHTHHTPIGGVGDLPGQKSEVDVMRLPEERVNPDPMGLEKSVKSPSNAPSNVPPRSPPVHITQTDLETQTPRSQPGIADRLRGAVGSIGASVLPSSTVAQHVDGAHKPEVREETPQSTSMPSHTKQPGENGLPNITPPSTGTQGNTNILASPLPHGTTSSSVGVDKDVQEAALKSGTNLAKTPPTSSSTEDTHLKGATRFPGDEAAIPTASALAASNNYAAGNDPLPAGSDSPITSRSDKTEHHDNLKDIVKSKVVGHDSTTQAPSANLAVANDPLSPSGGGQGLAESKSVDRWAPDESKTSQPEVLPSRPFRGMQGSGVDNLMGRHGTKGEKEIDSHFYKDPARTDEASTNALTSDGAAGAGKRASLEPFGVHDHGRESISSTIATKSIRDTTNPAHPLKVDPTPISENPSAERATPTKSGFSSFGRSRSRDQRRSVDSPSGGNHSLEQSHTGSSDVSSPSKVSFKNRLKGELKVISGKITGDDAKVEQGKMLKSGGSGPMSPTSPNRASSH